MYLSGWPRCAREQNSSWHKLAAYFYSRFRFCCHIDQHAKITVAKSDDAHTKGRDITIFNLAEVCHYEFGQEVILTFGELYGTLTSYINHCAKHTKMAEFDRSECQNTWTDSYETWHRWVNLEQFPQFVCKIFLWKCLGNHRGKAKIWSFWSRLLQENDN